jgi:hypothetical protein
MTDIKENIYNNIASINSHNDIINFVKENNIEFTENNNGFYVNISILSDELLNKLNELIINLIEYEKSKKDFNELITINIDRPKKKEKTESINTKKKIQLTKRQINLLLLIK